MTLLLPKMTPPADRPDALAHASRDAVAGLHDVVIVPPPGQTARPERPSAETLVERLRMMQMQSWG